MKKKNTPPKKKNSSTPSKKRPRTPSYTLDEECPICMGSMIKKDTYTTACNHIFHKGCICPWCERNPEHICPSCRQNISETCKKCKERDLKKEKKRMILTAEDHDYVYGELTGISLTPLRRGSTGGCGKKTKKKKKKKTTKKKKKTIKKKKK